MMPHNYDQPIRSEQSNRTLIDKRISRRKFVKLAAIVTTALTGAPFFGKLLPKHKEAISVVDFAVSRRGKPERSSYYPPNPEKIISDETTKELYKILRLEERHSDTISLEAFEVIIKRPARLATHFLESSKSNPELQEEEFNSFCIEFFKRFSQVCDELDVDFVAALLAFQVSGDNNNSTKMYNRDVNEERARVATSLAQILSGQTLTSIFLTMMRNLKIGTYYAMPRLEGPTSIGIHDIELIEICRAIYDLKETLPPNKYIQVVERLYELAPDFANMVINYVDKYNAFDDESAKIADEVRLKKEVIAYLGKFQNRKFLKNFLTKSNGQVDSYQFARTTVLWAYVNELETAQSTSFYSPKREVLENQALIKAVETYSTSDPSHFFFDQIANQKLVRTISSDARRGSVAAKYLLEIINRFSRLNDEIMSLTRQVESKVADKEFDLEFQLLTGIAHARSVVHAGYQQRTNASPRSIEYTDPDLLAFDSFMGLSKREASPSGLLTGHRPLGRATLTFAPEKQLHDTMNKFINEVYLKHYRQHPSENFRQFMVAMVKLLTHPVSESMMGIPMHRLENDEKTAAFIEHAKEFGAYQTIITLPHSTWMRCIEATAGYIGVMKN